MSYNLTDSPDKPNQTKVSVSNNFPTYETHLTIPQDIAQTSLYTTLPYLILKDLSRQSGSQFITERGGYRPELLSSYMSNTHNSSS
jgi:hypothetical protein